MVHPCRTVAVPRTAAHRAAPHTAARRAAARTAARQADTNQMK